MRSSILDNTRLLDRLQAEGSLLVELGNYLDAPRKNRRVSSTLQCGNNFFDFCNAISTVKLQHCRGVVRLQTKGPIITIKLLK